MTDDEAQANALVAIPSRTVGPARSLADRTLASIKQFENAVEVVGRTLSVGQGGYATIGEAVAEAQDGDTVLVRPGTYRESVTIERAITLRGDGDRMSINWESGGGEHLVLEETTANVLNLTFRAEVGETILYGAAAIRILGGAPRLTNLYLSKGHLGIVIRGQGSPFIRGCLIHAGPSVGIYASGGASVRIEDNEIFGNRLAGIELEDEGTELVITGNTISAGHGSGIFVHDGASGTIEGNLIFGNALGGIEVRDEGTAPVIRKNTIRRCQGGGIFVHEGAGGTIEGNLIFGNARAGIEVRDVGTAPVIRNNTIRDGRGAGIVVHEGAGGRLEGNRVFGNALGPLRLSEDASPVVLRNKFT